jgi:LacI family transcriptional regulator
MKDAHITLEDVAKRAGVSVSTASRALTGTKVKSKNQTKILQAATELGYVPNEAARSLRNVRTMTVGVVFHTLTGGLAIELIASLAAGFDAHGYSIFVSTAQGKNEQYDKLVHRFLERRVDALLCVHGNGEGATLDRFIAAGIPVASLISQSGGYSKLPLVEPTAMQAAKESVARLKALGHKNIVVLHPQRLPSPLVEVTQVAKQAKLAVTVESIDEEHFDALKFLTGVQKQSIRPTVIVALQTQITSLLVAAEKLSIAVPQALSLVAIRDRALPTQTARLSASMIHLDPTKVGAAATELILKQLDTGKKLDKKVRVENGVWIERETTGPAAK